MKYARSEIVWVGGGVGGGDMIRQIVEVVSVEMCMNRSLYVVSFKTDNRTKLRAFRSPILRTKRSLLLIKTAVM